MYKVLLNICLADMPKDRLVSWQKCALMPKFEHKFQSIKSANEIASPAPDTHQYLIIAHTKSKISSKTIKERISKDDIFIVYANNADEISSEILAIADDVWLSGSLELDKFRFEKTLSLIYERKEAWQTSTWFQATINTLPDMIWFKSYYGLHLEVNDSFCTAVNKTKSDIKGKDHYYIWDIPKEVYEQTDYVCVQTEDDVIAARKTVLFDEEVMKADGNLCKLKTYKTPIFDGDTIIGTVGVARDVTKEFEYLQRIERLAHYDQLTGLANRNQLDLFLSKLQTSYMSIACIDLDYFKQINDTYGHHAGDEVLVLAAKLIQELFPDALNVRMGGDEFICVFTDKSDIKNIPKRIQKLIDKFSQECNKEPKFQGLSMSVGIAKGKPFHGSFDMLLQRADDALYKAKKSGRGKFYLIKRQNNE
ncbi:MULTISPECIES: diguanylate cyclase domain-containing protein [unclassified Campylobacter]|uniref:sensor domain-containing diguanylate cyclase n=1 Tax=unclassified Campylobacter TaxID=2593542 RepID=UPI003D33D353